MAFAAATELLLLSRGHDFMGAAMIIAVVGCATFVLAAKLLRLYDGDAKRLLPSTLDEVPRLLVAIGAASLVPMFVVACGAGGVHVSQWDVLLLWASGLFAATLGRVSARAMSRATSPPERVAILGDDPLAEVLLESFDKRPRDVVVVELPGALDSGLAEDVVAHCLSASIERVVLISDAVHSDLALNLMRHLRKEGIGVSIVPRVAEETGARVVVEHVDGVGVMGIPQIDRSRSTMALKRTFDLAIAIPLILITLPVMTVFALAVVLTSKGPALYRQERVGRLGVHFAMLKFRTMHDGAHEARAALQHLNTHADTRLFKLDDDPRVTTVGRFLRSTSLDELPQLFNVLRGSMSIVGPRPLLPEEDGHVTGFRRRRLDLAPGLTGPWQVLQAHRVPFDAMVKIDYLYVLEWSPWTDVKIILRTLPVVLGGRSR